MKKKLKFYSKIVCVPVILIIIVLAYWIYSSVFSNPFPKLISNVNEICAIELILLISFTIYQIVDYSELYNEEEISKREQGGEDK